MRDNGGVAYSGSSEGREMELGTGSMSCWNRPAPGRETLGKA